jgi:hypothetical protein
MRGSARRLHISFARGLVVTRWLSTILLLLLGPGTTVLRAQNIRPTGFPAVCAPDEVQVLLLGTHHFRGSTRDAVSGEPENMLTSERQAQLEELVTRLARWAPEQVMVELPFTFADSVNARYRRYQEDRGISIQQDEVVQVGFRLARRLGHPTVYPIDYRMAADFDSLTPLLRRRPDLVRRRDSVLSALRAEVAVQDRTESRPTVLEAIRAANEDAALRAGNSRSMFGSWLRAGEGTNLGGPHLLARWYERNIYMAHYLTLSLLPGTRRILVLIGSGHVPPLRNILDESPELCPVSPLPLLR